MKVYVMTEAKIFQEERYLGVKKSMKEAEKALRALCPHMRPADGPGPGFKKIKSFMADASNQMLLFIHEEELD